MPILSLAFLAGVLLLLHSNSLPAVYLGLAAPLMLLALPFIKAYFMPVYRVLLFVAAGFGWTLFLAWSGSGDRLQARHEGGRLEVDGVIDAIPYRNGSLARFGFQVRSPFHGRVRLSWYTAPAVLRPGQRWRLTVKLKRPNGYFNPGGFDYERWLFRHRYVATGYVYAKAAAVRLPPSASTPGVRLHRYRHRLFAGLLARLERLAIPREIQGFLLALSLGERQKIMPDQWRILRVSGVGHLLAISGLHVGIVAAWAFWLGARLWAALPSLSSRLAAPRAGALAALCLSFYYVMLAGFSVPAQRAFLMSAFFLFSILAGRRLYPSRSLAGALLLVLVFDPFAVLSAGFWLSFWAVAVILLLTTHRRARSRAGLWPRIQWAVSIAVVPLSLFFMQGASLVAPLANFVAIPVVSLLVVPALLVALLAAGLLPFVSDLLLLFTAWVFGWLWQLLQLVVEFRWAWWPFSLQQVWPLLSACVAVLLLLMPRGLAGRGLLLIFALPVVFPPTEKIARRELVLTMLDVGQGLALVLRTQRHLLVYDTGPRFRSGFNTGDAVILPYLRAIHAARLDMLVISHGDTDHRGGMDAVLKTWRPRRLLSGEPQRLAVDAQPCRAGRVWNWDGVRFEILHPAPGMTTGVANNRSCVLKVSAGRHSVLIPGDIHRDVESALVDAFGARLRAAVLVVPHHGSGSSSSAAFLSAVRPRYALLSAGYRNRHGFPAQKVVDRYHRAGIRLLQTADCGALQLRLHERGVELDYCERSRNGRFWHRR